MKKVYICWKNIEDMSEYYGINDSINIPKAASINEVTNILKMKYQPTLKHRLWYYAIKIQRKFKKYKGLDRSEIKTIDGFEFVLNTHLNILFQFVNIFSPVIKCRIYEREQTQFTYCKVYPEKISTIYIPKRNIVYFKKR